MSLPIDWSIWFQDASDRRSDAFRRQLLREHVRGAGREPNPVAVLPLDQTKDLAAHGSSGVCTEAEPAVEIKFFHRLDQAADPFTQKIVKRVSLVRELFHNRNNEANVSVHDLVSDRRRMSQQPVDPIQFLFVGTLSTQGDAKSSWLDTLGSSSGRTGPAPAGSQQRARAQTLKMGRHPDTCPPRQVKQIGP